MRKLQHPVFPARFSYLQKEALRFVDMHDVEAWTSTLTPQEISRLAEICADLLQREELSAIMQWIDEPSSAPDGKMARWCASQLIVSFWILGARGIDPFTRIHANSVSTHCKGTLRWEHELTSVSFLRPSVSMLPLEVMPDDEVARFVEQCDVEAKQRLFRAAMDIRSKHAHKVIEDLLRRYPITEYREAAQIYSLVRILDTMGLY